MSRRTAARLAWSLCALSLVLALFGVFFLVLVHRSSFEVSSVDRWLEDVMVQVGFSPLFAVPTALSFSMIGALIASRRPDNPTGWIFCAIGLFGGLRLLCTEYAAYSLVVDPGSLPAGKATAWIASWLWVADFGLFLFLALMYPDGRLPSPRWRPFAQLVLVVVVVGTVAAALSPGSTRGLEPIENPLGIDGAANVAVLVEVLVYALGLVATASVLVRLRRSRGVERLQIKWFAYAAAVLASTTIVTYVLSELTSLQWLGWVAFAPATVGLVGMPVAVGFAILKYHLYDIDILINRTLVYGFLTALLAAVYFGGVATTQAIFRGLTGQEQQPQLAIVVSTLVIAALFNPLRRLIQSFIDRRFYRRKYDARKTLETFSAKLRDETDLDALSDDLVGVVRETMEPAHVSLWLRPDTASKGKQAG